MLEKLNNVQTRDLDLDALEQEKKKTPKELIATREQKASLQAALDNAQQRHNELRKQLNINELELEDLATRRKSAADSATAARNSKEASQYQNQELQFATRLQELEDDTIPLIGSMEQLEKELQTLKEQLAELEPKLEELLKAEDARLATVNEKIAALAGERDALAREIDASLLKQYEQVRRSKRGLGIVAIIDNQRCGGCNMRLPIHVIQKAKSGRGITRCPSCGRILWPKE